VVHVHGLGVDPGDQTLYAATHFGLFRIGDDGTATRIGNRYQDTMGFEVVGPGEFLGSGHPDFREFDKPLLGLIRSADAGQSWERLSLYGETDFHAIEAVHGRIYAYDSTSETFMVSTDGQEWDRRSQRVLLDVAVSPDDPDLVVAAAESGLLRSADGGRTWTEQARSPALAVLAWDDVGLYGVDRDGAVHTSSDAGTSWRRRGDVGGGPEAVALHPSKPGVLFVAVDGRGILRSDDDGATFTLVHAVS
jgi:photosystem II stability/assembly factor-like uncharacterized protein